MTASESATDSGARQRHGVKESSNRPHAHAKLPFQSRIHPTSLTRPPSRRAAATVACGRATTLAGRRLSHPCHRREAPPPRHSRPPPQRPRREHGRIKQRRSGHRPRRTASCAPRGGRGFPQRHPPVSYAPCGGGGRCVGRRQGQHRKAAGGAPDGGSPSLAAQRLAAQRRVVSRLLARPHQGLYRLTGQEGAHATQTSSADRRPLPRHCHRTVAPPRSSNATTPFRTCILADRRVCQAAAAPRPPQDATPATPRRTVVPPRMGGTSGARRRQGRWQRRGGGTHPCEPLPP